MNLLGVVMFILGGILFDLRKQNKYRSCKRRSTEKAKYCREWLCDRYDDCTYWEVGDF